MVDEYNYGDEKQVVSRAGKRRRVKQYDENAWNAVLNTASGRYVINCILEKMTHPFEVSFSAENTRLTDFREGERNVGNKLIAHAFGKRQSLYNLMREEHAKRTNGET